MYASIIFLFFFTVYLFSYFSWPVSTLQGQSRMNFSNLRLDLVGSCLERLFWEETITPSSFLPSIIPSFLPSSSSENTAQQTWVSFQLGLVTHNAPCHRTYLNASLRRGVAPQDCTIDDEGARLHFQGLQGKDKKETGNTGRGAGGSSKWARQEVRSYREKIWTSWSRTRTSRSSKSRPGITVSW